MGYGNKKWVSVYVSEWERERALGQKRQNKQPMQFFFVSVYSTYCMGKTEEVEGLFAFFVDPSHEDHHMSDEHQLFITM